MKKILSFALPLALLVAFSTSCREVKQISYVDMLKRESNEIRTFMDKKGIQILEEFPTGQTMTDKQFVEVDEGIYLSIKEFGNGNKPESGKTVVQARFVIESLADTERLDYPKPLFNNYEGAISGTRPLNFIYYKGATSPALDPTTPSDNNNAQASFGSEALLKGLEYVSEGGEVRVITSFRTGPSMAAEQGIPMYYRVIRYEFKR